MSQASRGSRVVFVGNIPFELTEEQLIDIFKEVGPVASFRLLFDRDTGRPKGYGFCEFYDAETAASAVRNLNEHDVGGRQLRVDYAAMDPQLENQRQSHKHQHQHQHPPPQQHQQQPRQHAMPPPPMLQPPSMLQPPPVMNKPAPSAAPASSVDEISKVLASMNSQELFTLMSQMKQMSFERPQFTRDFLTSNPQVAYALFQAMVMMNIVDPNIITRMMSGAPATPASAPAPAVNMPPAPPIVPVAQPMPAQQPQIPPQQPPMMASPVPPSGPPAPDAATDAKEHQKALLMQVLQLTDEQINALPPEHRDQIRQLKAQLVMSQPQ
ncbi:Cleavage stimulation factor subunit 2 [Apophysomyces ossiformis]|uniref:Cleavage stimulation factor subunit 2 n=1 Tax=Apophysomyces ossiformis TaxID=679940 RepID=A0A8H7ETG4_9FUNG|nr:Cleavage stimulation factor subunit 2 [Apophysomyces ossiformis]